LAAVYQKQRYSRGALKSTRLAISVLLIIIAAFILLTGRCLYLQLVRNDHYNSISVRQQQKRIVQKARRGPILDSTGEVLAVSNQVKTIFAEPRIIEKPEELSTQLAAVLHIGGRQIYDAITQSRNPGFAKIKVDASREECEAAARFYGVGVQTNFRRYYPAGPLAAHITGFTSLDNRGLSGIELQYDEELSGVEGQKVFFADAWPYRRELSLRRQKQVSDGFGIILTIDASIQEFLRTELLKQYLIYQAESAVAIVARPQTGEILAMASIPDFEPGDAASADANNFRNRAVNDQFEPGSILKPIVASIALDAGVINRDEKIFCENGLYAGKGFGSIREYRNHGYGRLSVREILVKSSNIGMAKIGRRLGKDKLHRGLKLFGFGEETGVELPGESAGLLWPVSKWTGYSVTRIPFGQEISVTAIQLIRAYCILANGGRDVRPHIVKALVDNDGNIRRIKGPASAVGFVIRPESARWIVREALTDVVNEGTGRRARLEQWQVFGKTGTANIAKQNERGYSQENYIASFIAGAPSEKPAVLVLVSIRKPNKKLGKGYTGGRVASPVAAAILRKTLKYLRLPED